MVWRGSLRAKITNANNENRYGLTNPKHITTLSTFKLWSKWKKLDLNAKVKAIIILIEMKSARVSAICVIFITGLLTPSIF